jgi:hypothetical protein
MADMNDRHQGNDDLFDETAPRSIFAATWFRAVLVLIVLGVIGAVAVPYILDAMNAPKPSATAKLPTPVPLPSKPPTPPPVTATPTPPTAPPGIAATPTPPPVAAPAPSTAAPVTPTPAPPSLSDKPSDAKLADTKPAEPRLGDSKPGDMKLSESKPSETKLGDTKPSAAKDAAVAATAPPDASKPAPKTTAPAATKSAAAKTTKPGDRQWYVQVGAFKDPATAKKVAAKLREDNYTVEESPRGGATATVAKATTSPPTTPGASGDQYDVIITGQSPAEINKRLAAKGLSAEPAGNGAVVKPSLPLRDAVALSKDLAVDGLKVQVRRAGGSVATAAQPASASSTSGGDTLHRVSVGGFPDRAMAMATLKELEAKGYKPFLTRR